MKKFNRKSVEGSAAVFKALGHPTRLWMVEQLRDGQEVCVGEFVKNVGAEFATISRHLAMLKSAGIVTCEKHGREIHYRLVCPCVMNVVDCLAKKGV